jgi:hypothetical protein
VIEQTDVSASAEPSPEPDPAPGEEPGGSASAEPLIQDAVWVDGHKGWILRVTPTAYARAQKGSYETGEADWAELAAAYPSDRISANAESLKNQLICHQQFATVADPTKPTWDLEAWRPPYSYIDTVAAECNPGGAE